MLMDYVSLGRTGMQVSRLCLGAFNFGLYNSAEDAGQIIDRALDAGINFIDTANSYGWGTSEEIVGEALRRRGGRDGIVLATKVWGVMDDDDPNAAGGSRRHIIEQCEGSLRRLQTDHIDLYQLHRRTRARRGTRRCGRSTT
jgi:aryl-alcohol dehydrogenase-like predicted oxidoreductase